MNDIVSLSQLQTAMPTLSAAQLADAPQIIASVTREIADRYPRAAPRETYDETFNIGQSRTIQLSRSPIIQINRIRAQNSIIIAITRTSPARRATAALSFAGSRGLVMCAWNPALIARFRSSADA